MTNLPFKDCLSVEDVHAYIYCLDAVAAAVAPPQGVEPDTICAVKKAANKYNKRAGAKAKEAFEREQEMGKLGSTDATTFRALAARANDLVQDRADLYFAAKELCKSFAAPNEQSLIKLKRLGRYFAGRKRLVHKYELATTPATHIDVFCDTDFAGCAVTRRSTSGGCGLIGAGMVKHWSKSQTPIALSSAWPKPSASARLRQTCTGI